MIFIFNKIKASLVNKIDVKKEKFSIINDIINFISYITKKYEQGLNLNNILKGDENTNNLMYNVSNYVLDFYFDWDFD